MKKLSFTLKSRLRNPRTFDVVFQSGKRLHSQWFIFFCLPNQLSFSRLGIVISKRKCRLSVHRSHVRRLIREAFRANQHDIAGFDVIVLLKSAVDDPYEAAISVALDKQFQKLRVFKEKCG